MQNDIINILMVEDDASDVALMRDTLRKNCLQEYKVDSVSCLKDALALPAIDKNFDLIMLDLTLPDSTGLNTVVRAQEELNSIPIIVTSAVDDENIALKAVRYGAQDYLVKGMIDGRSISRIITHAIERHRLWQRLEEVEQHEHYLATRDHLTGLPNRYTFNERLGKELNRSVRQNEQVGVIFLDLDRFKVINDTLGHLVGDELLCKIGNRIKHAIRSSDTIARLGGDEFIIMLPQIQNTDDIAKVCRSVLERLKEPVLLNECELTVGASLGVAVFPYDGDNFEVLVQNADTAMYAAKAAGRNNFQFYAPQLSESSDKQFALVNDLRRAVNDQEFELHFQPLVNVHSNKVSTVEVLLRWRRSESVLLYPENFISVCESSGLILPIGNWVLREACRQNKQWQNTGLDPIRVSVHISVNQFTQSTFIETVSSALDAVKLDPQWLVLELTEETIMQDPENSIVILSKLKDLGVKLAIDDFGAGSSTLSYLKKFPIDILKVDKSFIVDLVDNRKDQAIVEAIVQLANALSLNVCAEGVETTKQRELLSRLGCDLLQGYFYVAPITATEIETILAA